MEWIASILLLITITITVYLSSYQKVRVILSLTIISILFTSIILYIRIGFGRYFTTIDESYYVSLLGNPSWYRNSIVSGYITPFILHALRTLFFNPVWEVIGLSIIAAIIYTVSIFLVYKMMGLSSRHSIMSLLVLLMTPLYLWSVIQVRPQQIGLLVGLFIIAIIVRMKPGKRLTLIIIPLYILLIFSHILSFIVYSLLLVIYSSIIVLVRGNREYLKKYWILSGAGVISWVTFLAFPYSKPILKNIRWLFDSVTHLQLSIKMFLLFLTGSIILLLLLWYILLSYFSGRFKDVSMSIKGMFEKIDYSRHKTSSKFFALLIFLLVLGVIYIQFRLGAKVYTYVYKRSLVALLFFQLGNLIFALMYIWGILLDIKRDHLKDFDLLSLLMALIAGGFLFLSFFMPSGNGVWGFHNWFIRGLQYFVPLAAPLVASQIIEDIESVRTKWQRPLISVFLALIIMISVLNTARVPGIYNYNAIWSPELVNLCNEFQGDYTPRNELPTYAKFVENNLLKACGSRLLLDNNSPPEVSSDTFYVHPYLYSSMTIGQFINTVVRHRKRIVVLFGGNIHRNSYILSLFGRATFIHLNPGEECPLKRYTYPMLLVGGPVSNPCVQKLEHIGALNVKIGSNYVVTPKARYLIPLSKIWWNATKGLFVIQSIKYNDVPILLVEGTNLDATLAGIYYLKSSLYNKAENYRNVHYIVGSWKETDGTVISAAKGAPIDTNGFSPGDRIIVLEKN